MWFSPLLWLWNSSRLVVYLQWFEFNCIVVALKNGGGEGSGPVAAHPHFSGWISVTVKWERRKMLAGHQGVSSTLSWVTYTQKSLCLNCGKFVTVTIYGSFHYRIPYVCQFMQTDSWTWSFVINKWNDVFHHDKRVLACYASRLQSLSCQFTAQTDPSFKSQMAARPKYIIY